MNRTRVTTEGQEGMRPGREATTGVNIGHDGEDPPRKRRRKREEPEFSSYYGRPILNKPTWEARDIAGYLYLGGLAGASSLLGAGAQLTGRPRLARSSKTGAAIAIGVSFVALVHDLGRPARFFNMLRVFKVTSPMNVGSWLLSGFGPLATLAAASDVTGGFPGIGTAATVGAAVLGPAVAAYTAALVSNTAVPSWHEGYREMPFVFVSSGAAAAAGLGLAVAPIAESGPAQRLAVAGGTAELILTKIMERRMGIARQPYHEGTAGRFMHAADALTSAGVLGSLLLARRSRVVAIVSGLSLMAGSAATRFGIFHAGVQSTEDPRYTVSPQKERQAATSVG